MLSISGNVINTNHPFSPENRHFSHERSGRAKEQKLTTDRGLEPGSGRYENPGLHLGFLQVLGELD